MSQAKHPITVVIPPKPTHHRKPTEVDYWKKYVHKYGLEDFAQAISTVASASKLPRMYLLALVVLHPSLRGDYAALQKFAEQESARVGINGAPKPRAIGLLPKNYTATIKWSTYGTGATSSVNQAAVRGGLANPALTGKNGKPIKDIYGAPIHVNDLKAETLALDDLFMEYVGRHITRQEAIKFTINHWSDHKIAAEYLTKMPSFFKGTLWKSSAPLLVDAWETVYGVDKTLRPPKDLIRQAILRGNAGKAWFADAIRKLPQYRKSVDYLALSAEYTKVYSQIYGEADDAGKKLIDNAIMGRMNADQFQTMLKQRPEYANSYQMQGVWGQMGDMLGSIFGRPAGSGQMGTSAEKGEAGQAPVGTAGQAPPPAVTPPAKKPKRGRPTMLQTPVNARSGI